MNNAYTLVWSFRNRIDIFIESIRSADATSPKEVNFCLVDGSSDENTITKLREFCNTIHDRTIRICESTYRTTCQEAWNLGIMLSDTSHVLFTSSDCILEKPGWVEAFDQTFAAGADYVIVENHSLFGISRNLVATIGWFDEVFQRGPHVDVDYMIRATELCKSIVVISNDGYHTHFDDIEVTKKRLVSDVPDRLEMHTCTNENIFKQKWQSSWPGWKDAIASGATAMPHPPTHINTVKRIRDEINSHPLYTKRYNNA